MLKYYSSNEYAVDIIFIALEAILKQPFIQQLMTYMGSISLNLIIFADRSVMKDELSSAALSKSLSLKLTRTLGKINFNEIYVILLAAVFTLKMVWSHHSDS